MLKSKRVVYCNIALLLLVLLLVGCSGGSNEETQTNATDNDTATKSEEKASDPEDDSQVDETDEETGSSGDNTETSGTDESAGSANSSTESGTDDSNGTSSNDSAAKDNTGEGSSDETGTSNDDGDSSEGTLKDGSKETSEDSVLSAYSSKEIEYARVWLQLGPNQQIDELNVQHIPAGQPVNPDDATSATYPEDVIQLAGGRLVDGSVTYSGNGDGTINVYNVPLRWDSRDDLEDGAMLKETENIVKNTEKVYIDPGSEQEVKKVIDLIQ
ncbi:hypothetical protein AB1K91_10255 [Terribacillus sp. 179-K 1B1 HS]|uniref:hypothetical protein n=1 Tax=Terribacillus sp. 179-K 1B1 HS TaxID=3142388 RepID=UPI0039A1D56D